MSCAEETAIHPVLPCSPFSELYAGRRAAPESGSVAETTLVRLVRRLRTNRGLLYHRVPSDTIGKEDGQIRNETRRVD